MKIKLTLDTIHLNFFDTLDEVAIGISKSKLDYIDMFPKIKKVFEYFNIPKEKLNFRNNSIASKISFTSKEDIYFSIKTMPSTSKFIQSNSNIKIVGMQIKGTYLLRNKFSDFIQFYNNIGFQMTISKIDIAIDFNSDLVREVMSDYLLNFSKMPKMKGGELFLNLDNNYAKGFSYKNTSRTFKIYNKLEQLKFHNKNEIYFLKNMEFIDEKELSRIEISFQTTKRIKELFNLDDYFKKNPSENDVIKLVVTKFFDDFKFEQFSKVQNIINESLSLANKGCLYAEIRKN